MKITQNYHYLFVVSIARRQEDIILVNSVYLVILGHEAFPWGCSRPFSDLMGCVGCG